MKATQKKRSEGGCNMATIKKEVKEVKEVKKVLPIRVSNETRKKIDEMAGLVDIAKFTNALYQYAFDNLIFTMQGFSPKKQSK